MPNNPYEIERWSVVFNNAVVPVNADATLATIADVFGGGQISVDLTTSIEDVTPPSFVEAVVRSSAGGAVQTRRVTGLEDLSFAINLRGDVAVRMLAFQGRTVIFTLTKYARQPRSIAGSTAVRRGVQYVVRGELISNTASSQSHDNSPVDSIVLFGRLVQVKISPIGPDDTPTKLVLYVDTDKPEYRVG